MPSQITVTAKTGPAIQNTTKVYTNLTDVDFRLSENVLRITQVNGPPIFFDLQSVTTVTYTISGGNATVAVS